MTIYIDDIQNYPSGRWCHMATDGDIEELHAFAARLGLKRMWFQQHRLVPHYDLRPSKAALAKELGAQQVSSKTLLALCRLTSPVKTQEKAQEKPEKASGTNRDSKKERIERSS